MMQTNKLYCGDNLEIMSTFPSGYADLIYADPPYFSQRDYGDFDDRFDSMESYLDFMRDRLQEMHLILKPTGSLYLHVDWHAVHYLKIEMDKIFGNGNPSDRIKCFRNEIVWCYSGPSSPKMKQYARKHDIILWYSKGKEWTWNVEELRLPYAETSKSAFKSASKLGGERTKYLETGGRYPEDWWTHIPSLKNTKEKLGYPTQKPLALLERIIKASSNPGDIVFDPFCGCGTALATAKKLGREYIGIDSNFEAIKLTRQRLSQIATYGGLNADPS